MTNHKLLLSIFAVSLVGIVAAPPLSKEQLNKEFMEAAYRGDLNMVNIDLGYGADVNAPDEHNKTALEWAAQHGNLAVVARLLQDVDVNAPSSSSALVDYAAMHGDTAVVKLLLEAGVNVNAQNNDGWTALMKATFYGNIPLILLLLDTPGIDVNTKNNEGQTALTWAAVNGRTEAARLLLNNDATTMRDRFGKTALMYARENANRRQRDIEHGHGREEDERELNDLLEIINLLNEYGITH